MDKMKSSSILIPAQSNSSRPVYSWGSVVSETKALFLLGIPLILAQLIQMSMGIVDTIMTGHYNSVHLAAVAIGEKTMMMVILFGWGLISATQIVVAQLHGAKALSQIIGQQVVQGLWLGQIYGVLAWVMIRNMLPLLPFLEFEPQVFALAQEYMKAFSWGVPAMFLFASLRGFYEGISISRLTFYFTLLGLAINVIGNYTLIFGHFGAPELGAVGAGWTSTLANWMMVIGLLVYTRFKKEITPYQIFPQLSKVSWQKIKHLLQVGTPIGMSLFIEVSVFSTFSLMMVRFGTESLAANQIAIHYVAFIFMIPLGLGMATTTRVGIALGSKNIPQAQLIGWISICFGGGLMMISSIIILLFPQSIANIFSNDAAVLVVAAEFLILGAIFQIPDGIQVTAAGVLRGWKDTKANMIIIFISFWGIGLGFGYYLAFRTPLGASGLWYGLITGLSIQAILMCGRLYFISHRRKNTG